MTKSVENGILKRAVIAGASAALKYRKKKANISEEEVLEEVIANVDSIIDGIDKN